MITQNETERLQGVDVYGSDGGKIGSAGQVYLDDVSGEPEWVSVRTGLFGTKESFIPLREANLTGDRLEVPFGKDQVKDAPRIESDGDLSPAEEDELYTYYGFSSEQGRAAGGETGVDTAFRGDTGHDTSGPTTDDAMTRSEEHLVAGTRTEQVGRARLRKYVVSEQQQVNVPVAHEEARLEREPITDANIGAAMDGPEISEEEHEVVLHEEQPVVEKRVVPQERVRLDKEVHTDEDTVSEEVRKERIEADGEGLH